MFGKAVAQLPYIECDARSPVGRPRPLRRGTLSEGGSVMSAGGAVEKDFSAICGLYWKGSAWYDVLDATCATQGEANLGKLCPVYSWAREHRLWTTAFCPLRTVP